MGLAFVIAIAVIIINIPDVSAQMGIKYFGGKISAIIPCGNGLLLKIKGEGGSNGGNYLYQEGTSILFPNFKISPGFYVIGAALKGGYCPLTFRFRKGKLLADGTILMIGTGQEQGNLNSSISTSTSSLSASPTSLYTPEPTSTLDLDLEGLTFIPDSSSTSTILFPTSTQTISGNSTPTVTQMPAQTYTATPTVSISQYPIRVTVNVNFLRVRSSPSTTASLAGSKYLRKGDSFMVAGWVTGENIGGENRWWVSSKGNYVWVGGTKEKP